MRSFIPLLVLFLLTGCSTTSQPDTGYLDVNSGADVVDAFVENPFPDCVSEIEMARLDTSAMHRVYIDSRGNLCK